MLFHSNDITISIGENQCHPGYNVNVTPTDNGACWFAYPMEFVSIETCYKFDEWLKGNFDFTPLTSASIFDIKDSNPISGTKKPIYTLD